MMTLTEQQTAALTAMRQHRQTGSKPFVLGGLAGTGKTTVANQFVQDTDAIVCAPTGRAAQNLAGKCGKEAFTVHRLTMTPHEKEVVRSDGSKVIEIEFRKKTREELAELRGKTILCDECSMVGAELGEVLDSLNAKIFAVGDFGQLQPVNDRRYFDWQDFRLTDIMRQAADSGIIRQAYRVRRGLTYEPDQDVAVINVSDMTDDILIDHDARICFGNAHRCNLNKRIRKIMGLRSAYPLAGETVVCLHNCPLYGIYNGMQYTLLEDFPNKGGDTIVIEIEGRRVRIPQVQFIDHPDGKKLMRRGMTSCFDYGYVFTCHKAQGSEWDSVLLIDDHTRPMERAEWLYTGITRAREKLTIVTRRKMC